MRPGRRARGFTLVEILVALLILGIMTALGYGTYRAARISGERTEESLHRSREIEFGMRVMAQDFSESVPRPVRDILGALTPPTSVALNGTGGVGTLTPLPASASAAPSALGAGSNTSGMSFSSQSFSSGSSFGTSTTGLASLIDLTRAGWSNTAAQQRGTLQRVSYTLVDDVLKRSYMVHLDNVQSTQPIVQNLFTRVKAIQLRYLDSNNTWQTQWPPPGTEPPKLWVLRPVAVEIIIEFKDWGRIRRLIEVAG